MAENFLLGLWRGRFFDFFNRRLDSWVEKAMASSADVVWSAGQISFPENLAG
jgi:hypothetical protein